MMLPKIACASETLFVVVKIKNRDTPAKNRESFRDKFKVITSLPGYERAHTTRETFVPQLLQRIYSFVRGIMRGTRIEIFDSVLGSNSEMFLDHRDRLGGARATIKAQSRTIDSKQSIAGSK